MGSPSEAKAGEEETSVLRHSAASPATQRSGPPSPQARTARSPRSPDGYCLLPPGSLPSLIPTEHRTGCATLSKPSAQEAAKSNLTSPTGVVR